MGRAGREGAPMRRDPDRLESRVFDLAVVGGGVHGACAAREAARRGLSVCLVERDDFGAATSANSLRILHGGLRYLQRLGFSRIRRSLRDQARWRGLVPDLVREVPFVVPTRGWGKRSRWALGAAVAAHRLVAAGLSSEAGGRPVTGGSLLSSREVLELFPCLEGAALSGGAAWHELQAVDTQRILLRVVADAAAHGAVAVNHAEVVGLAAEGTEDGSGSWRLAVRDGIGERRLAVEARAVLNAAGPWVDRVLDRLGRAAAGRGPLFRPSVAFNLVMPGLGVDRALGLPVPRRPDRADGGSDWVFLVPWQGRTLLGTRHLDPTEGADREEVPEREVVRLLDGVAAAAPGLRWTVEDVEAVLSGRLPVLDGDGGDGPELLREERRVEHATHGAAPPLTSLVGVKWTEAPSAAESAVSRLCERRGIGRAPPREAPLPAAWEGPAAGVPDEDEVRGLTASTMAVTLEDLVFRRLDPCAFAPPDRERLEALARWMAAELGWSEAREAAEVEAVMRRGPASRPAAVREGETG